MKQILPRVGSLPLTRDNVHVYDDFFSETTWPSKAKFYVGPWEGGIKYMQMVQETWPR